MAKVERVTQTMESYSITGLIIAELRVIRSALVTCSSPTGPQSLRGWSEAYKRAAKEIYAKLITCETSVEP